MRIPLTRHRRRAPRKGTVRRRRVPRRAFFRHRRRRRSLLRGLAPRTRVVADPDDDDDDDDAAAAAAAHVDRRGIRAHLPHAAAIIIRASPWIRLGRGSASHAVIW